MSAFFRRAKGRVVQRSTAGGLAGRPGARGQRLLLAALALPLLLGGCLEVEQYPQYVDGQYDGKRDNLPEAAYLKGDREGWTARVHERQRPQNEYNRMGVARRTEP